VLKDAVTSNLDAIHGRLPEPLRAVRRRLHVWSRRAARLGSYCVALVVVLAGVARWSASTPAVPGNAAAPITGHAKAAANAAPDLSSLPQPIQLRVLALSVRRVIIDAGHGGGNLGTSSADGIHEKDVTLDIAERVRRLTVQRGFEAIMTRTADETRSLRQRADTANGRRGDIFVSIHLNSLRPSSARGIETYYLGPGNGPELDAIAAAENRHSGYSLSDIRSLLEKIYTDAKRDESRRLAESVQRALVMDLRKMTPAITDRGVKTAPFVVLVATDMPAILAEVSCLSNADDARRLNTADYRQHIAEALVSGIQTFAYESDVTATEKRGTSGS